jgi:hypothetical protein
MTSLVEEYDCLDEDLARQYYTLPHELDNSAVKDMVIELEETNSLGQKSFVGYECDYCHEQYPNLADFERHCYYSGDTHHDANLGRTEAAAIRDTAKIRSELQSLVEGAIQAKKNAEYKAQQVKERVEQQRIKSTLPYVKQ